MVPEMVPWCSVGYLQEFLVGTVLEYSPALEVLKSQPHNLDLDPTDKVEGVRCVGLLQESLVGTVLEYSLALGRRCLLLLRSSELADHGTVVVPHFRMVNQRIVMVSEVPPRCDHLSPR